MSQALPFSQMCRVRARMLDIMMERAYNKDKKCEVTTCQRLSPVNW
jgi:hypothetical protein